MARGLASPGAIQTEMTQLSGVLFPGKAAQKRSFRSLLLSDTLEQMFCAAALGAFEIASGFGNCCDLAIRKVPVITC